MDTENDLPRSNVRRIVKQKITQLKGASGTDVSLNKDALTALTESCRVFIHLLSATANDICLGNKRQTISVEDVIAALEDLEFGDLVSELEGNIEGTLSTAFSPSPLFASLLSRSEDRARPRPVFGHSCARLRPVIALWITWLRT